MPNQEEKTYFYQEPITLLKYLKKTLGTENFDEKYFSEGLKKENFLASPSGVKKYQDILFVVINYYDSLNLDFQEEHWDMLFKHIKEMEFVAPYDYPPLFGWLYIKYVFEKNYKLADSTFNILVNNTFKGEHEQSIVFFNMLMHFAAVDKMIGKDFLYKVWPIINEKSWFINYLLKRKSNDIIKSFLKKDYIVAYKKVLDEQQSLNNCIGVVSGKNTIPKI